MTHAATTPGRAPRRAGAAARRPTSCCSARSTACCPVFWVLIASTKTRAELFNTFTCSPSFHGGFPQNLRGLVGLPRRPFLRWALNSLLYAGVGTVAVGLGLRAGRLRPGEVPLHRPSVMFSILLAGVLIPGITLAIPQYLLLAKLGLAGSYWSVLLPSILSPYGIYLCRIYAAAAMPDEMLEAGADRRGGRVAHLPLDRAAGDDPGPGDRLPLQFVASWNNFLLPFIMLVRRPEVPAHGGAVQHAATREPTSRRYTARHHRGVPVDHPADRALPGAATVLAVGPALRRRQGVRRSGQ